MKRNLLFPLAVLLFFSTNVKAQEIHEASVLPYVPNFIPTAYTQGGKVLFFTVEGGRYDNESLSNGDFTVYDADFGSPDKPGGLSIQLCKSEKKEFYIRYSS